MTRTRIAVVVATRKRADALSELLSSLESQVNVEPRSVEVVVVLDGAGRDFPAAALRRRRPYEVQVLERPRGSTVAAFETGWRAARSPVVLFLDDELRIGAGLVAEHLAGHVDPRPGVVLGAFHWVGKPESGVTAYERRVHAKKQHALLAREVPTGIHDVRNVSVARPALEEVGGFHVWLPVDADVDLGERLRLAGCRFEFRPGAVAEELSVTEFDRWRDRYVVQGRLAVSRNSGGAGEGLAPVIACFHDRHPVNRLVVRVTVGSRSRETWTEQALRTTGDAAHALGMRRLSAASFSALANVFYWSGVRDGLRSSTDFWRLVSRTRRYRGRPYALARPAR